MIKKYEKYKESGIEWLGEIPEYWNLRNLEIVARKDRYSITGGPFGSDLKNEEYTEMGVRIIQLQNIGVGEFRDDYKIFTSEDKANQLASCNIFPGEIIIAKMADPVARACIIPDFDERYIMASDGIRLEVDTDKFNVKYIEYSINAKYFNFQAELNSTGTTRLRIGLTTLKKLKLILPSHSEQTQIANFLDHQTTIIDDLIGQKEKLIALLKEKRQAIINEAVTKGLNHNAKMKYSGIEWLGEVPEEWKVLKLKYLLRNQDGIKIGPFGSALKLEMMIEDGYKVYGQENAIKDNFEIGKRYITQEKFLEMESYKLQPGDIIITMMGTTGKSKVVPENIQDGIMDSHLIRIRVSDLIIPELLALLINDSDYIKTQLDSISKGAIMTGLNSVIIKSLNIIVPPKESQKELLEEIDRRLDSIFVIMKNTLTQITKLKDYRQSLISEAVTGKIDVREWRTPNP